MKQIFVYYRESSFREIVERPQVVIFLWALWISAAYWLFGKYSYIRVNDNAESIFSYQIIISNLFTDYGYSAWIPNIGAGIDGMLNMGSSYFTYEFPLFLLFPKWIVYALIMFTQRFLAALFTYKLCRDFLKIDKGASILAGFFWSLGTWTTNDWTMFDALGPPLIPMYLYLLELGFSKSRGMKYAIAALTGILLSYFSFFPLFTPFFIFGSFIWFIFIRNYGLKTILPVYLVFGLFSFSLDIKELYAIYVNLPFTGRMSGGLLSTSVGSIVFTTVSNVLAYFLSHKALWIMIVAGLLFSKSRSQLLVRLSFTAISIVLASNLLWAISAITKESISIMSIVNFNGFVLIATFIPSVAAACAVDGIRHTKIELDFKTFTDDGQKLLHNIPLYRIILLLVSGLVFFNSAGINLKLIARAQLDNFDRIFQNPVLTELASEVNKTPFRVASVGVSNASAFSGPHEQLYPAYAAAHGLESVDGYFSLYSERYQEFWGEVLRPIRKIDFRVDDRWKTKPIWVYLYAPFDGSFKYLKSIDFTKYYNLNLLSLANTKYIISPLPLEDKNLILQESGSKTDKELLEWSSLSKLEKGARMLTGSVPQRPIYVYENLGYSSRAFVAGKSAVFSGEDALLDSLSSASLSTIKSTVFLEQEDAELIPLRQMIQGNSNVSFMDYTPDRIVISVDADHNGILVITNNYSPFWKCDVDGIQSRLFPVYHTFQGIYLEAGKHEIILTYDPPY